MKTFLDTSILLNKKQKLYIKNNFHIFTKQRKKQIIDGLEKEKFFLDSLLIDNPPKVKQLIMGLNMKNQKIRIKNLEDKQKGDIKLKDILLNIS